MSSLVSLAIAICLTQVAAFSTTIYLHRCATHRSLFLHPAIAWLFRFAMWITTGLALLQVLNCEVDLVAAGR